MAGFASRAPREAEGSGNQTRRFGYPVGAVPRDKSLVERSISFASSNVEETPPRCSGGVSGGLGCGKLSLA